jgi:hypothetical protein
MNRPLILTDLTGLQAGQKSETQQKLIPLPKALLDLASLDRRTTSAGEVYKLTPDEIKKRVALATLVYNGGFKRGERDAQVKTLLRFDEESCVKIGSIFSLKNVNGQWFIYDIEFITDGTLNQ